jgi:hypothetical protein
MPTPTLPSTKRRPTDATIGSKRAPSIGAKTQPASAPSTGNTQFDTEACSARASVSEKARRSPPCSARPKPLTSPPYAAGSALRWNADAIEPAPSSTRTPKRSRTCAWAGSVASVAASAQRAILATVAGLGMTD